MPRPISDARLMQYLAGELAPADRRRVEAALAGSPDLTARLEKLRYDEDTVRAVKDSAAIRLPETEEERIRSQALNAMSKRIG